MGLSRNDWNTWRGNTTLKLFLPLASRNHTCSCCRCGFPSLLTRYLRFLSLIQWDCKHVPTSKRGRAVVTSFGAISVAWRVITLTNFAVHTCRLTSLVGRIQLICLNDWRTLLFGASRLSVKSVLLSRNIVVSSLWDAPAGDEWWNDSASSQRERLRQSWRGNQSVQSCFNGRWVRYKVLHLRKAMEDCLHIRQNLIPALLSVYKLACTVHVFCERACQIWRTTRH